MTRPLVQTPETIARSRRPRSRITRRALVQGSLGAAGLALVGCTAPGIGKQDDPFALVANPAKDEWPQMFWDAPEYVQETYRYVLGNKQDIEWMPCFCGCVDQGHDSNWHCYVDEERGDGTYLLDPMSFG